jgi:phosphoribosylformylglycinamidine (FGAM) synthase PurS component
MSGNRRLAPGYLVGRYLPLVLSLSKDERSHNVTVSRSRMCRKLLANPVIEKFRFEIEEAKG